MERIASTSSTTEHKPHATGATFASSIPHACCRPPKDRTVVKDGRPDTEAFMAEDSSSPEKIKQLDARLTYLSP